MDWRREAINDLRKYEQLQTAVLNLSSEISFLEEEMDGLKSSSGSAPVKGGMSNYEDKIINNIVKRDKLKLNYRLVRHQLLAIERGLKNLSEDEYVVLLVFFINRPTNPVELINDKLHIEKSQIYRIKDVALYKFTVARYGIIDL